MSTYYELLGITSGATTEEIRSAYDENYRQLSQVAMRHHDQSERLKAEQKRLDLEQAYSTLSDPEKRVEYDAKLANSQSGGLFDPEAPPLDQTGGSPPFVHTPPRTPGRQSVGTDVWICPRCGTHYPKGTMHCKEDGYRLGMTCPTPGCGRVTEASASHCEFCGVNLKQAEADRQRQEEKEQQERILRETQARNEEIHAEQERAALQPLQDKADSAWTWTKVGCVVVFFFTIIAAVPWIVALLTANRVLSTPQSLKYDDAELREKAKKARMWSAVSLAGVGGLTLLCIIMWLLLVLLSAAAN